MNRLIPCCVALLLLLLSPLAHAQQDDEAALDTVFVVDSPASAAATVVRITPEMIEAKNAAVAYDALEFAPGLHVANRLALTGAGLTRLAIRGTGVEGPAGLTVFVDGVPDPTVSFAHPAPQAHSVVSIAEVEVIYGPSPVLYGSGNTGIVNIRTREPGPGWSGRLTASGGSFGTTENAATTSYRWDRGFVSADATYRYSEGYLPDTDAWVAGGRLQLGYQFADDWRVRLSAGQVQDHFAVFGPFSVPGPFGNPGTEDLDLTRTVGDVTVEGRAGGFDTSVKLWGDVQVPRSQVVPEGAERADVYEAGVRLRSAVSPWTTGRLTFGVDVLRADARNTPALPPTATEQDVSITEVGLYLFAEERVAPWLTLNGGVRLTSHSEYGAEPSGEAGVIVRPGGNDATSPFRGTRLTARVSRGFQSPTLQQLFGVFRGTPNGPPNPELEPERVTQIEAGVHQRFRLAAFRVAVFLQQGDNLIVPVMGELQNAGEFEHYGMEAGVRARPLPEVTVDLGASAYDLSDNVLRIPWSTFDFSVAYRPAALRSRDVTLSLYGQWNGKLFDQAPAPDSPRVRLDDYFVLNAKLRAEVWQDVLAFVEVDNITDEAYATVIGVPMPGASVFAGASLTW